MKEKAKNILSSGVLHRGMVGSCSPVSTEGKTLGAAAQRGKYDTVSTGSDDTRTVIITAEKKHGKFGKEAAHHQAMCKYEIIILFQNASSLYISLLDFTSWCLLIPLLALNATQ